MKTNWLSGQWLQSIRWKLFSKSDSENIDFSTSDKDVFHILLLRPTRYDDNGYPIQWYRASIPSNSLACLNGISSDCARRQVLGAAVEIRVSAFDEASEVVNYHQLIKNIKDSGQKVLVCLVGVQSNQFPRAMDIAAPFLTAGLLVCMGGFHVSGSVTMLKEMPSELVAAQNRGISLFAGEAEANRFDIVIQDAWQNNLKKLYDYTKDMVELINQPLPLMSRKMVERNLSNITTIDLGRGCPFNCSFCCIINVQGRKSRTRSADDLEKLVRKIHADGHKSVFITDDNFARNKQWEVHFDRLIQLRKEGIKLNVVIQVDTLCHKIDGFIEKAIEAGVSEVFIGLENINPDNLECMNKRQNTISEYRKMLLHWKRYPVVIWGAYIIGLPNDTKESILRDIDIIKRELPIDLFNASILTPLPGSSDHCRMVENGEWMDPDFNNYDLAHRVIHHQTMTDQELEDAYIEAWDRYYTFDHMVTIFKRMFALGSNKKITTLEGLIGFGIITKLYGIRSYDMGLIRRKSRFNRRPGMPVEHWLPFYLNHIGMTVRNLLIMAFFHNKLYRTMKNIMKDPLRHEYRDTAITEPSDKDVEVLRLYKETRGVPQQ